MTKIPPNVPRAVLNLDRPRTMTLQLDALARLRDATGDVDVDAGDMAVLPSLIWCGLIDGDREDTSPDEIRSMLHAGNLAEISEAIESLTEASQPKGAEGNAVPAPPKVKAGKKMAKR